MPRPHTTTDSGRRSRTPRRSHRHTQAGLLSSLRHHRNPGRRDTRRQRLTCLPTRTTRQSFPTATVARRRRTRGTATHARRAVPRRRRRLRLWRVARFPGGSARPILGITTVEVAGARASRLSVFQSARYARRRRAPSGGKGHRGRRISAMRELLANHCKNLD